MTINKSQQTMIPEGLQNTGYMGWEDVKRYIFPCLAPVGWNNLQAQMAGQLASSNFLDLTVYYYIHLQEYNKQNLQKVIWIGRIAVKSWGISMQTLKEQAIKNTDDDGYSIQSIEEILRSTLVDEQATSESVSLPLYVLTNQRAFFGAAGMLDKKRYKRFAEKIGQNLYIIPSSVHEILLCSDSVQMEAEDFEQIIKEVNETQLATYDKLADHAYYYDKSNDKISIYK